MLYDEFICAFSRYNFVSVSVQTSPLWLSLPRVYFVSRGTSSGVGISSILVRTGTAGSHGERPAYRVGSVEETMGIGSQ
jgi:hypothetical protein